MPALDAILFFLGGLLAFSAGLAADWWRRKQLFKLIKRAIRDDLTNATAIYDDIIKDYASEHIIKFIHTQAYRDSRAAYDRNRDSIILFDDPIRIPLYNYYLRSGQTINSLEYSEKRKEAVDEIEARLTLKYQSFTDPKTTQPYPQAVAKTMALAEIAPGDLVDRNNAITYLNATIGKLSDHRAEARQLLQKLPT